MSRASADARAAALRLAARVGAADRLVHELAALHVRQWGLEASARRAGATDTSVAALKRAIDASNAERHAIIDAIDAAAAYRPQPHADRLYSETPGELCDRLLILERKSAALAELEQSGPPSPDGLARVRRRREQLALAVRHLDRVARALAADMSSGRAACPPRVGFKIYEQPGSERAAMATTTPDRDDRANDERR
jgi:Protein of unknown function (DUF4254)